MLVHTFLQFGPHWNPSTTYMKLYFLKIFFGAFEPSLDSRKNDRKVGITCSKGLQVRFKPWAAAARTESLYMAHTPGELTDSTDFHEMMTFTVPRGLIPLTLMIS